MRVWACLVVEIALVVFVVPCDFRSHGVICADAPCGIGDGLRFARPFPQRRLLRRHIQVGLQAAVCVFDGFLRNRRPDHCLRYQVLPFAVLINRMHQIQRVVPRRDLPHASAGRHQHRVAVLPVFLIPDVVYTNHRNLSLLSITTLLQFAPFT